jgi:NTP pyrophosphatase (non-canonical NTP hydrolase)
VSDLLSDGTPDFLTRLRDANERRAGKRVGFGIKDWTPAEWAVNLAGEVGEALNVLKKMRRISSWEHYDDMFWGEADEFEKEEMRTLLRHFEDELADVMICVDLLAARFNLDLNQIVARKFNATSERWNSPVRLKP